jgi:acyl transferase domain-containing protein/acyl-CoA thioesterase FadM
VKGAEVIPRREEDIAIVGMGLVAPGASSPEELWQVLRQPTAQLREPERFEIGPLYSEDPQVPERTFGRTGGFIHGFVPHERLDETPWRQGRDQDDPMDTEAAWLRHCLLQALDSTVLPPSARIGCYVATGAPALLGAEETVLVSAAARGMAGHLAQDPAARQAHELRLRALLRARYRHAHDSLRLALPGPVVARAVHGLLPGDLDWVTVSAACASSLNAVDLALVALRAGDCEVALAGALSAVGRFMTIGAAKFGGMSHSGDVRAFDADADGTIFSEAAVMVALKRLEQARRDGDEVLGLVSGTGLSSDGRGRSISAPDAAGEARAIRRAWGAAAVGAPDIDWVVAHGTGTRGGDETELAALSALAGNSALVCSSNKSLLGHTAWASGGVSLVQTLLALRNQEIPRQQRFDHPHADLADSPLVIPATALPWPARAERPRTAGVSSFGLGGVNAHLLVQDRPLEPQHDGDPCRPTTRDTPADLPDTPGDPVVLVSWSGHLPGHPAPPQVRDWLAGQGHHPERSFGPAYPDAPFQARKLPPVAAKAVDRSHLMALDVAHRFVTEHGELWQDHRENTGVIAAISSVTRAWRDSVVRSSAGDLESLPLEESDRAALDTFLAQVRDRQPFTEESFAGSTPSIAAHRIANRWDLHGPALTVDTGTASAYSALHTACRFLTSGRLDIALVLALNEGADDEALEVAPPGTEPAEGAFLLALTRRSLADEHGWPVLAELSSATRATPSLPKEATGTRHYGSAEGAVEVLRALHAGDDTDLICTDPAITLTVRPTRPARPAEADEAPALCEQETSSTRWAQQLRATPAVRRRPVQDAVPSNGVLLVSSADLAAELAAPAKARNTLLLSTDPATSPTDATVITDPSTPQTRTALTELLSDRPGRLLLIADVTAHTRVWPSEVPQLSALMELTVLVLQEIHDRLDDQPSALALLIRDPLATAQVHPETALFTGLARALATELGHEQVLALVTDAGTPAQALAELAAESAAERDRTVVAYRGSVRHTEQLVPQPLPDATPDHLHRILGPEPVIVAVGGGRGITPVLLQSLNGPQRPTLWIIGRSDPVLAPRTMLGAAEDDKPRLRRQYVSDQRAEQPGTRPAELAERFETLWRNAQTHTELDALKAAFGEDRVRYLTCDITDPAATRRAADTIREQHGTVDLLIHAACQQYPADLVNKPLPTFRQALAVKTTGYRNLRQAVAALSPRIWVNFGSILATTGFPGESEYCAANDFLAAAARHGTRHEGRTELTLGWGLWTQTGKVAGPLERETLRAQGMPTGMSDSEGIRFFRAELACPRSAEPAPVFATAEDRTSANTRLPGLFTAIPAESIATADWLGTPTEQRTGHARWELDLDPTHDRCLAEHLIDARPSVPAAVMMALALQAARHLLPSQPLHVLQNMEFTQILRTAPTCAARIEADLVTPADPATAHDRVRVRFLSDLTTRDGRPLAHNRHHATIEVHAGPLPETPRLTPPAKAATAHTDPSIDSADPVLLTGVFRNLFDLTTSAVAARGRWQPVIAPEDRLAHLPAPALLIDALLRLNCSTPPDDPGAPQLSLPTRIGRIELHQARSDADLAARHPDGIELHRDFATGTYTAHTGDGTVLLSVHDLTTQDISSTDPAAAPVPPMPEPPAATVTHSTEQTQTLTAPPAYETTPPDADGKRWFAIHHLATVGETTMAHYVHYSHLLNWQGKCRETFGFVHFPAYMNSLSPDSVLLTASASCEYLDVVRAGERLSIRLNIPWVRLNILQADFTIHRITSGAEHLVARGTQTWANARNTGDPEQPVFDAAPWPEEILNAARFLGADTTLATPPE